MPFQRGLVDQSCSRAAACCSRVWLCIEVLQVLRGGWKGCAEGCDCIQRNAARLPVPALEGVLRNGKCQLGQGLVRFIPYCGKRSPAMRNFAALQHGEMPQCET